MSTPVDLVMCWKPTGRRIYLDPVSSQIGTGMKRNTIRMTTQRRKMKKTIARRSVTPVLHIAEGDHRIDLECRTVAVVRDLSGCVTQKHGCALLHSRIMRHRETQLAHSHPGVHFRVARELFAEVDPHLAHLAPDLDVTGTQIAKVHEA